jgi:hypothetical protein
MSGPQSKPMYEDILTRLGQAYRPDRIKGELEPVPPSPKPSRPSPHTHPVLRFRFRSHSDGKFAAMMQVSLCNDGPVTIILDTRSNTSVPKGLIPGSNPRVQSSGLKHKSKSKLESTGGSGTVGPPNSRSGSGPGQSTEKGDSKTE